MKLQRRHLRLPRRGAGYGSPFAPQARHAVGEAAGIQTAANEDEGGGSAFPPI